MSDAGPIASVIIPAHNEEAVIGRLLDALTADEASRAGADEVRLEIVVVPNGCTDDTAAIAARSGPEVTVIDVEQPSKRVALQRGDEAATAFPRLYLDADVEISRTSVYRLAEALASDGVLAAGPERIVPRERSSILVRWYYDVWERLPQVRTGLFGRGVIALSEEGNARLRTLPAVMGDDLAASDAFEADERTIVPGAQVTVWPPRTMRDLFKRRVRAVTGNAEADAVGIRQRTSVTSARTLVAMMREQPRLIPRVPVFLGVAVASRLAARRAIRRGDTDTWLRDESSRQAG